jgi:hypothetical protein
LSKRNVKLILKIFSDLEPLKKLVEQKNVLKMISHLLLTVLTNFSRNVTYLNVLSRATVGYPLFFALEQLGGGLQRRKMRIYDS